MGGRPPHAIPPDDGTWVGRADDGYIDWKGVKRRTGPPASCALGPATIPAAAKQVLSA
ncbi:MAG TPA: hypothetical protein VK784_06710 [Pseudonocardiaceae bacterium]|nr:hypothetical protein [Pseudonocardiaceae bacterium]